MRWYPQQEADGTFTAVRQNADGSFTILASHVAKEIAEQKINEDQARYGGNQGQPTQPTQPTPSMKWEVRPLGDGRYQVFANDVGMNVFNTDAEARIWMASQQNPVAPTSNGGLVGGDIVSQYKSAVSRGDYTTANTLAVQIANKTVDEMRRELVAQDGRWSTAGDNEVTAEYLKVSGKLDGSSTGSQWDALWNAQMDTNREYFDWEKADAERNRYSGLAQSLLGAATSLRGPEDYLSYAQYTHGANNLVNKLYSGTPASAFGMPSGFTKPMDINQMLKDLGLT